MGSLDSKQSRLVVVALTVVFGLAFGVALYFGATVMFLAGVVGVLAAVLVMVKPLWGMYLALALMPLEGAGRVSASISTLTWAKLALLAAILSLLGVRMLRRDHIVFPANMWLLYVAFASSLAGTTLHSSQGTSFWGIIAFVGQAMIVVVIHNLVDSVEIFENTLLVVALSSVPVALFGLLDFTTGSSVLGTTEHSVYASGTSGIMRVTSTFNDPNALGTFMVFAIAITLGLLLMSRFRDHRAGLTLLLLIQGMCLLLTFSRGSFLSATAVVLGYALWERRFKTRLVRAAIAGLVVLAASTSQLVSVLVERFTGGGALALDVSRLEIYRIGLDVAWGSPLFGYGPDNVPHVLGAVFGTSVWPHSLYLEVLLGTGVVGSVALLVFVVRLVGGAWSLRHSSLPVHSRTAVLALAGVLIGGITLHVFRANELWICLGLLACLPRLLSEQK